MTARVLILAALVLTKSTSAQAVSLVVMAHNDTAVPGAKVFTIGVNVTAADVARAGGTPDLLVANVAFIGGSNGPIQQANTSAPNANEPDVQSLQLDFINTNTDAPPDNAGMSQNGLDALYADSWWYNSFFGYLIGKTNSAGVIGKLTNQFVPGDGVYTMGAFPNSGTNAVGHTGFTFFPAGSSGVVPANATTGQTMSYTGIFGQTTFNYWDPGDSHHVLGNDLVANGGTLTVPLAQIVARGDIQIPSNVLSPSNTELKLGIQIYNVLGGSAFTDPHAFLDYNNNTIHAAVPEPPTLILAALSGLSLLPWRWRRSAPSRA